jgi:hypothetical protein
VRGNPRPFVFIAIAVALIVAFFVVVAPLFNTSSNLTAEIAVTLPTTAIAGRQLEIDAGIDNTGTRSITPICVTADVQGPIRPDHAIFGSVDRRTFNGNSACGGSLAGQATVSVRLFFNPTAAGRATISLRPATQARPVGTAISGSLTVAPA